MNHLKFIALLALLMAVTLLPTQLDAQQFLWSESAGGSSDNNGNGITTDAAGNVIAVGEFSGTCNFQGASLTCLNGSQAFVAKYDPNHNILWAKQFGGQTVDHALAVTTDEAGNVYVAARTSDDVMIDTIVVTGGGQYDITIVKYDRNGQYLWAQNFGGDQNEVVHSIAYSHGYLYLSGAFQDTAYFGTDTLICASQQQDAFVMRMDTIGQIDWIRTASCATFFQWMRLAVDANDDIYAVGQFDGNASFGPFSLSTPALSALMVARLQSDGTVDWAQQISGSFYYGAFIAASPGGSIYLTGQSIQTMTVDGHVFPTEVPMYVLRLDQNGHFVWLSQCTGSSWPQPLGIVADAMENVYVTGPFKDSLFIGNDTLLSGYDLVYQGFVAHYDDMGQVVKTLQTAPTPANNFTVPNAIRYDSAGALYVIGDYVGNCTIGADTLPHAIGKSIFITKLSTADMVAVPDLPAELSVTAYPNPTNGTFLIEIPNFVDGSTLEIYSSDGRLAHQQALTSPRTRVDAGLRAGVYVYVVTSGRERGVGRVVVE